MRPRIVAGNWKMNTTRDGARALARAVVEGAKGVEGVSVVLCPPFPYLITVAEIVAGLWEVSHPAVTDLLTALSDHHPEPSVARAARKAAFKARSPVAAPGSRSS